MQLYDCCYIIAALCLFSICTTAFANNNNVKVASKLDAKDVKNRIVTTVTIQDVKSDFVSSYNVEDENSKCSRSADGKEIIAIISVGDEKAGAKRAPAQANSNTFYGWKGNARISWYDDGTWDYHKTAGDDWTKISGSYDMTGKKQFGVKILVLIANRVVQPLLIAIIQQLIDQKESMDMDQDIKLVLTSVGL